MEGWHDNLRRTGWKRLMLATFLKGATATNIEYVGGYVQGFSGTTSNVTISLTSLTGGLASAPAAGDLVIVYFGTGAIGDRNLVVSGYTEVAELFSDDTYETNLAVAYKFMGGTPDTSFVLSNGTGNSSEAGAVAVQVWRGVNVTTPLDVAATTATGLNSVECNPPAITPVTSGAVIVSGGAGAHTGGVGVYSSSNLTSFISVGASDSYDVTIGLGYHRWTSGAFDPAQFTFSLSDSTTFSWAAVTLALRPA
jgi:hypothetical protein